MSFSTDMVKLNLTPLQDNHLLRGRIVFIPEGMAPLVTLSLIFSTIPVNSYHWDPWLSRSAHRQPVELGATPNSGTDRILLVVFP